MSIVPSGRRREQIAQDGWRSASIFDSDMFAPVAKKYAQGMELKEQEPATGNPKDLKMEELQQALNQSNTLPPEKDEEPVMPQEEQSPMNGDGSEFIDISKRISGKVIDALGLNSLPGEHWAGKTEIINDGDEVTGITIKLTRARPKDMGMQERVEKDGPGYGEPIQDKNGKPNGPITNSV